MNSLDKSIHRQTSKMLTVLLGLLLIFLLGCNRNTPAVQTNVGNTSEPPVSTSLFTEATTITTETTPPSPETTGLPPVTTDPPVETTEEPATSETEAQTEPVPDTTEPPEETTDSPDYSQVTQRKRAQSMTSDEDPAYMNPLTGLPTAEDLSMQRPAAIMINNLKVSCPQNGIAEADIIYECLAEGGVTRLMMLALDYVSLSPVGSIRSARDYFLDFAADYDALFIHAGGSTYAYDSIDEYDVDNLDGVNMYIPNMFYRDAYRLQTMGTEHSLMTSGDKIASGVRYKKYRTAIQEDFDYPLDFIQYGTVEAYTDTAKQIHIPLSVYQITDFIYDDDSELYLRYQFNGNKHIDGTTGEQLSFENVILLFCETGAITGDAKNRIDVETTGRGKGYYATLGTFIEIEWVKDSYSSPIRFYYADGQPLLVNRGKTFITVCPTTIENKITFN